ncbi:MAG: hypothetical protein MUF63_04645 [Rhodobacteraceae bacterium]|nr:hypothetical protein [Paracoccaceae bacterium]
MTESSAGGTGDPAAQRGAGINPMQAIAARLTAAHVADRAQAGEFGLDLLQRGDRCARFRSSPA